MSEVYVVLKKDVVFEDIYCYPEHKVVEKGRVVLLTGQQGEDVELQIPGKSTLRATVKKCDVFTVSVW